MNSLAPILNPAMSVLRRVRGAAPSHFPAALVPSSTVLVVAASAATAPVAVAAGITATGFCSAGIGAGTYAATMMSTAAIANGGGVAAGSMVATLQSVGVLGITSLGAAPVIGICLVGAGVGMGSLYLGKQVYCRL